MSANVPQVHIEQKIYLIRGHKVMLDSDLAKLYGVTTKRLNEQVKRNCKRFPSDFMFKLNKEGRIRSFEVAICDLKNCARWADIPSLCFYRAGSCDAV